MKIWRGEAKTLSLQRIYYEKHMEATTNIPKASSVQAEFIALLERGRQIKARRQKEAAEWLAERRRRQHEAALSGYYNIEGQ